MDTSLRQVLKHFVDFTDAELDKISSCFREKSFVKNEFLLKEGSVCKEFYFVQKGCIRIFFNDRSGHEKTRYVMLENYIGTALSSFISQTPSVEFIEAIEDTKVLAIKHEDFFRLCKETDQWQIFYQRILEMAYTFQNKKIEQLVTLTAKQRYELILKENPLLIQRLSNRTLASYLDIREETLSRLKSAR